MRFLKIGIAILFALFDLTKAAYYGGDFINSYAGSLPFELGFPLTGYSQYSQSGPSSPAPVPPSPAPASKPYGSYPPQFGPIITPFGPILPASYQPQPPVFIPTHIDKNGRRHIRIGDHSFVQVEDTDSTAPSPAPVPAPVPGWYGYYGNFNAPLPATTASPATPPTTTAAPATPPTPTTVATTTFVITTAPTVTQAPTTTPSTVQDSTTGKGGIQSLSYYRNLYGEFDNYPKRNYGAYGQNRKLINYDVNDNNELVIDDGTQESIPSPQQATTTLATATVTDAPDSTAKWNTKYLNHKKTSKFHFKITPDNLLNVITL